MLDQSIQILLHGLHYKKLLEHRINSIQEKYGLRKVDVEVLYYLSHCNGKDTARDIIHEMNLTKGHISQSVDRLGKMGILVQVHDHADRRYVHLTTTEQATAMMEEIQKVWDEFHHAIFEGVTEEEKKVLRQVAQKIRNNLEKELK